MQAAAARGRSRPRQDVSCQRDASKAITYAQQALAIQPKSPEAQNLLIRAEIISGDLAGRKRNWKGSSKRFPNSVGVEKLNAMVQLASKQPDAARASFVRALEASRGPRITVGPGAN